MEENILLKEAHNYLDQGIGVLLKYTENNVIIGKASEGEPIIDKEILESLLNHYPEANLAIVIDQGKSELVAIAIEDDDNHDNGQEEFRELTEQHGVPQTLAFRHPDGSLYYLFRARKGYTPPTFSDRPGLSLKRRSESILVFPSILKNEPVSRVGSARSLMDLEEWLASANDGSQSIRPEQVRMFEPNIISPNYELAIVPAEENSVPETVEDMAGAVQLLLPNTTIQHQTSDTEILSIENSGQPALDSFINEKLGEGKSKEETFRLALKFCRDAEIVESEKRILFRVIDTSANIVYKDALLDQPIPFILEMSDYLMVAFVDEHDQPQAFQKDKGEVYPLVDKTVNRMLRYYYLKITGQLTKTKYMTDALSILEMKTQYEGEKITLSNRVAKKEQKFFFDMGNANSIQITPQGWEIVRSPILFRRFGHQVVQVVPTAGGDPWKLFDYLNTDEEDKLLLMVYVISLFVPDIAHPLLNVWGEHGSAKSFLCTAINQLCDPTSVTKMIINRNDKDLVQNLYKHYVTVYDNLSEITPQMSDIFCQACTGSSFNKRRLYTDSDDIVFRIKHAVILNSIEMLLMRQDLIDRSILLHMKRIPADRRLQEETLWTGFEADKPSILGGIFDCLVKAVAIYPDIHQMDLPRMADFYQWGYAITEALGIEGKKFVEAYANNVSKQNNCVRHNNTLCQAVIELMDGRELHESTVKATLEKLSDLAKPRSSDATFPKAPKDLAAHLGQIKPTLAEFGIEFTVGARQGKGTPLKITKVSDLASPASPVTPEPNELGEASEPGEAEYQEKTNFLDLELDDAAFGGEI